jgi:hypothetical protein
MKFRAKGMVPGQGNWTATAASSEVWTGGPRLIGRDPGDR